MGCLYLAKGFAWDIYIIANGYTWDIYIHKTCFEMNMVYTWCNLKSSFWLSDTCVLYQVYTLDNGLITCC